ADRRPHRLHRPQLLRERLRLPVRVPVRRIGLVALLALIGGGELGGVPFLVGRARVRHVGARERGIVGPLGVEVGAVGPVADRDSVGDPARDLPDTGLDLDGVPDLVHSETSSTISASTTSSNPAALSLNACLSSGVSSTPSAPNCFHNSPRCSLLSAERTMATKSGPAPIAARSLLRPSIATARRSAASAGTFPDSSSSGVNSSMSSMGTTNFRSEERRVGKEW